jgi:hypothetical protein
VLIKEFCSEDFLIKMANLSKKQRQTLKSVQLGLRGGGSKEGVERSEN